MTKITAVTISVNYSKYFKFAAARNRKHFARWVVVTRSDDIETLKICADHNIDVVTSDCFNESFQKSVGINQAFQHIDLATMQEKDLLLHIDADTILPGDFLARLGKEKISDNAIYGMNRAYVRDPPSDEKIDELFGVMAKYGLTGHGYNNSFTFGYFQLFTKGALRTHGLLNKKIIYPEYSRDASTDDVIFPRIFANRNNLDITCIHLGDSYKNWNGI